MNIDIGCIFKNCKGRDVEVIELGVAGKVKVSHKDSGMVQLVRKDHLLAGAFKDPSDYTVIGEIFTSNGYGRAVVIKDIDNKNKLIRFLGTGYETTVTLSNLRRGSFKDKLFKKVADKGYIGEGPHSSGSPGYSIWLAMLKRCYKESKDGSNKTYLSKGVTVCNDWLNFQIFSEWFNCYVEEYNLNTPLVGFDLDKDITGSGLLYSPQYCNLVPEKVNNFYKDVSNARGWKSGVNRGKPFTCSSKGKWISDHRTVEECVAKYGELKLKDLDRLKQEFPTVKSQIWENIEDKIKERFINGI